MTSGALNALATLSLLSPFSSLFAAVSTLPPPTVVAALFSTSSPITSGFSPSMGAVSFTSLPRGLTIRWPRGRGWGTADCCPPPLLLLIEGNSSREFKLTSGGEGWWAGAYVTLLLSATGGYPTCPAPLSLPYCACFLAAAVAMMGFCPSTNVTVTPAELGTGRFSLNSLSLSLSFSLSFSFSFSKRSFFSLSSFIRRSFST
mmetsp:Transcript_45105/g.116651  ORF Transcript_45105/g.116651 Transcript_45105/m.116651 type:complete len:202 (-) Transcript_45105:304-909(-)